MGIGHEAHERLDLQPHPDGGWRIHTPHPRTHVLTTPPWWARLADRWRP